MNLVRINSEPCFLLRPGPGDRVLLDRLLSPDFFSNPVQLDGLVIDAPRISLHAELRSKLPKTSVVMVDPQAYRLQRALSPEAFESADFSARFVTRVLDEQQRIGVTSYVAPAFFIESRDSPWCEVNARLLRETAAQVGQKVFATLCGSYSAFCRSFEPSAVVQSISGCPVEGVLVLVSPIRALGDSPTKLANYLRLLEYLSESCGNVVACRQPAFGLGCMALGVSGFDSGIATTERFDYTALTRPLKQPQEESPEESKKGGGARKRMIYLPQLLTAVPYSVAEAILSTSGVAGSFVCTEPCCKDNVRGALIRSRDHFIYTRLKEVAELRNRPHGWRREHFNQTLIASRQMAEKVMHAFPDTPLPSFQHLDVWSRVLAGVREKSLVGVP